MRHPARVLLLSAALAGLACSVIRPPNPQPTPPPSCPEQCPLGTECKDPAQGCQAIPPPGEPCSAGQNHSCWHWPPDSRTWLYACPVYDTNGGVVGIINVVGGPAQCPAVPPVPPDPPDPPQPPEQTNCDGTPGALTGQTTSAFGQAVNEVMRDLTGCAIGTHCDLLETTQQQWLRAVVDGLRARGICAGQHEPGHTDEIAVSNDRASVREGYHVFGGDDSSGPVPPGGVRRTVVWAPGAARPSYYGNAEEPPPGPDPEPGACGNPLPPKVWTAETLPPGWGADQVGQPRWELGCVPHGNVVDCTPKVAPHACDYCAAIGMGEIGGQPRCGCPVRQEGASDRVACEQYLTGGTRLEPRNGASCSFANDNPLQFRPNSGNCRLCSVGDPRVCGGWF